MNYNSYLYEVSLLLARTNLRAGQVYMNKLPNKLYERVTGTEHDCYYDNSKIESFLDWLLHQPEVYVE